MTPTQRSLALLKQQGYTTRVVEHWNAWAKIRQDLYGFIDIVALHPERKGILGIQTTTADNVSKRITKALALEPCRLWISCGNRIEFHGWKKTNNRWEVNVTELMFEQERFFLWPL